MAKRQHQDNESAERPDAAGSNPSSNEERLRSAADDSLAQDSDSDVEDAEDIDEEEEDSEGNF